MEAACSDILQLWDEALYPAVNTSTGSRRQKVTSLYSFFKLQYINAAVVFGDQFSSLCRRALQGRRRAAALTPFTATTHEYREISSVCQIYIEVCIFILLSKHGGLDLLHIRYVRYGRAVFQVSS